MENYLPQEAPMGHRRSHRDSQSRKTSYDARYTSLVNVVETANSCNANDGDVYKVLSGLGANVTEQGAVIVINNRKNPETDLLVVKKFQRKLKSSM
ncbi:hypothetical protein Nepgr_007076 [Nepenthes gracilis]|uniref:Uncharacterized protein n=1 Tax=Nepenthes gracilis TaxID=150966 RepID=A0AAD3XI65_NEPGR|nr:hypothetical protein Nepgr_007076 [Nepenthes gracilis]